MKKINILHFCNEIGLGGTERAALSWCKYLDKTKFNCWFATFNPFNKRRAFCEEIDLKVFSGDNLEYLLEELDIDIVHLHRAGFDEPLPFTFSNPKTIIMETNIFAVKDNSELDNRIKAHLFMSKTAMNKYLSRNPKISEKIYDYLYNPVDPSFFENNEITATGILGRVSRNDNYKWGRESIYSIPLLLEKFPSLKYRVIGATPEIKDIFATLNVSHNIEYLPQLADEKRLKEFYNSINIFLHSSQIGETFGSVIAEAMASKLPVVTVRGGTYHERDEKNPFADNSQEELVEHKVTGFVCENLTEYVNTVIKLLENPEMAKKMGEAGYKKARREYDAIQLTKKLEAIYFKMVSGT